MINILDIKSVIETSMLSIYFQSDKEEFTTGGKKKRITSYSHNILDRTLKL